MPSVLVFTRPIEMSMFLIQSSLSFSSTDLPCTPMLATLPPGRTISVAMVKVPRYPYRLDGDVDTQPVSQGEDLILPVRVPRVDRVGRAEVAGPLEPGIVEVDGDHLGRPVQPGRHDGREADGSGSDHRDHVTRLDLSVLHADLETGRQDVREQDAFGIGDASGTL